MIKTFWDSSRNGTRLLIDNAAAIAAGLPVGAFYRNGDTLCIVH